MNFSIIIRLIFFAMNLVFHSVESVFDCRGSSGNDNETISGSIFHENSFSRKIETYKDRPRPDQKSLLIVFDATISMNPDLAQLREGAQEIVTKFASREDNPIYNYILSVYRDPGRLYFCLKNLIFQAFLFKLLSTCSSQSNILSLFQD